VREGAKDYREAEREQKDMLDRVLKATTDEKKEGRSDWGEKEWKAAGVATGLAKGKEVEKKSLRSLERGSEAPQGAPKGPRFFPKFCTPCKVTGHSDLTCFRQDNAPTPGPSNHQKPVKQVVQRTPRRGLGYKRSGGTSGGPERGGEQGGKGAVHFEREKEKERTAEDDTTLGKLVLTRTTPRKEMELEKGGAEEGQVKEGTQGKGKAREGWEKGGEKEGETGNGEVVEIHLSGCRAPPEGDHNRWKKVLRANVEAALRKADSNALTSVLGGAYHFNRRNEKTIRVRVEGWSSRNSLLSIFLGAAKRTEQNWSIKGTEVEGWVEVIVARVDGREVAIRAERRAEEIAKRNGWKLASRAPQWAGQRRNYDTYEGKETGLIMTLIRRNAEMPDRECEDSTYKSFGKTVIRKLEVYQLHREGTNNYYFNKDGYKVCSRTSQHGPYVPVDPQLPKGQMQGLQRLETYKMWPEHETASMQPVQRSTSRQGMQKWSGHEGGASSLKKGNRETDSGG